MSTNIARIKEYRTKRNSIESDWNENIGDVKALYPDFESYKIALETEHDRLVDILVDEYPTRMHADSSNQDASIVVNERIMSAVLMKPEISASTIAKSFPEKYDVFAQVCVANTYIANIRLQKINDSPVDQGKAINFQCELENSLKYVDTFRNIRGGSESAIVDSNLQRMLATMVKFSNRELFCEKVNTVVPSSMYLASSACSEHCLLADSSSLPTSQIVIGSEVKGIDASIRNCYPQLITVCGNSAIELFRLGLQREDSVVPGIVMAGANVQFLAVYLIKDNFPVLVELSPELSPFRTLEEKLTIAEWCLRLVSFAIRTKALLDSPRRAVCPNMIVRLNISGYFAKPVRDGWKSMLQQREPSEGSDNTLLYSKKSNRLNNIMRLYERIRLSCEGKQVEIDIKNLILFPEGVVSVPGNNVPESVDLQSMLIQSCIDNGFRGLDLCYRPLILFPLLKSNDGWSNNKPSDKYKQSYREQLGYAIAVLNTAGVAHLDMRPPNIMWRGVDTVDREVGQVELYLIDFEDAIFFDFTIPAEFIKFVVTTADTRYPFAAGDEETVQVAKQLHNDFFLEAVSQWADSDIEGFREFTDIHQAGILSSLKELA